MVHTIEPFIPSPLENPRLIDRIAELYYSSEENKLSFSDFGKMSNDTEITDIDIDPFLINSSFSEVPEIPIEIPKQSYQLQSILSGKQSSKVTKKLKKNKVVKVIDESDGDISDNLDSSFTESKSNDLRKEHEVLELEKKMYGDNAGVSAKDLFSRFKKISPGSGLTTPVATTPPITTIPPISTLPPVVSTATTPIIDDEVDTLEAKMYLNIKSTSASEFLKSKPKEVKKVKESKVKKKKGRPTMFITLKVSPETLSQIKSTYNPLFTKGNEEFVKDSSVASSDFFKVEKKASKLFDSMMNTAKAQVKLTPLQKLKELQPPILTRDLFHVYEKDIPKEFNLSYLEPKSPVRAHIQDEIKGSMKNMNNLTTVESHNYIYIKSEKSKLELLQERIPNYKNTPQLNSIVERVIKIDGPNTLLLWTQLFQPETMDEVLMHNENTSLIRTWIRDSFVKLRSQSLQKPRNVLLKQKKQKLLKLSSLSSLDGFIDDSFNDVLDSFETLHDNIFVPLLILKGDHGTCKSSSIYAAMQELNGYVHEINTGVNRGRKDIFNSLKEFCTTQLVHQQNESKTFQQGLVLLEDVNILFEQDKNFWLVVSDVLNISRRPIVLTCEDLDNVPKSLLEYCQEEKSIIHIDDNRVDLELLQQYLWVCALSQGYDILPEVLQEVIQDNFRENYDLRKCLMDLQHLCRSKSSTSDIYCISRKSTPKSKTEVDDLETLGNLIDTLSAADITNEISQLNHEVLENELVGVYVIDETHQLTQQTLTFELNIGDYIKEKMAAQFDLNTSAPTKTFFTGQLREMAIRFFASRSKPKPKFIQDFQRRSTRSRTEEDEIMDTLGNNWLTDKVGVSDTSCLHYLNPLPLILEVLPVGRDWLAFQNNIDIFEKDSIAQGMSSMKQFLNYRDFQESGDLRSTFESETF